MVRSRIRFGSILCRGGAGGAASVRHPFPSGIKAYLTKRLQTLGLPSERGVLTAKKTANIQYWNGIEWVYKFRKCDFGIMHEQLKELKQRKSKTELDCLSVLFWNRSGKSG